MAERDRPASPAARPYDGRVEQDGGSKQGVRPDERAQEPPRSQVPAEDVPAEEVPAQKGRPNVPLEEVPLEEVPLEEVPLEEVPLEEVPAEAVVVDERPDTLIDERRAPDHPEQYGRPGRPLARNTPFALGFGGALGVFLAWFLIQAIVNARAVLVLIVVSMFLAVGLNPAVEWLINRGMRRVLAVATVFVAVIAAFAGFASAVVPPLVDQTRALVEALPDLLGQLQRSPTIRELDQQYGVIDRAQKYVASGALGERAFGGIVGVGRVVLGALFSAVTVLILTLYFLASLPGIKRHSYRLVPSSRRERVSLLGDEILMRIGGYVSGAMAVALIAGVISYVFLVVIGLNYALPLSLFVGIMALIPMIGATIAAVVVCVVAFVHSTAAGIACVVFYIAYQQIENYFLYPRVMRHSVDVPAAATIMAALIGGTLLGVVGALLAIPTAAAVLLIVREVVIPRQDRV